MPPSTCRVFVAGRSYLQTVLQVTIYNYSSAIRSDRAVSIFLAVCRVANGINAAPVLGVSPDEGNVYVHPCPARHDASALGHTERDGNGLEGFGASTAFFLSYSELRGRRTFVKVTGRRKQTFRVFTKIVATASYRRVASLFPRFERVLSLSLVTNEIFENNLPNLLANPTGEPEIAFPCVSCVRRCLNSSACPLSFDRERRTLLCRMFVCQPSPCPETLV